MNDANDLAQKICETLKKPKIESKYLLQRANDFTVEKSINEYVKLIENNN